MVEYSPATRVTRVRFPADAYFLNDLCFSFFGPCGSFLEKQVIKSVVNEFRCNIIEVLLGIEYLVIINYIGIILIFFENISVRIFVKYPN